MDSYDPDNTDANYYTPLVNDALSEKGLFHGEVTDYRERCYVQ